MTTLNVFAEHVPKRHLLVVRGGILTPRVLVPAPCTAETLSPTYAAGIYRRYRSKFPRVHTGLGGLQIRDYRR